MSEIIVKFTPPYIERVVLEMNELNKNISKLELTLVKSMPDTTSTETELLKEQLEIMKTLSIVLKKRIALYK